MLPAEVSGTVSTVLNELDVPQDVVDKVISLVEDFASELQTNVNSRLPNVASAAYGSSSLGLELARQNRLAHAFVLQEVLQLIENLTGLSTGLLDFTKRITEADTNTAAELRKLERAADGLASTTYGAAPPPTYPRPDGSDA